jgi:sec-independent protein translocase protein TatC
MNNEAVNVLQHFEELRKRLMIIAAVFIAFLALSFIFVSDIYQWLVRDLDFKLAVLGPSEILWVYFMLASVVAIAAAIPVAAHQIWLFVSPALTGMEKKVALSYIPALFFLFITGIAFGYFILLPLVLNFLMTLSGDMFTAFFTTEKYFQFVLHLTLPFGFLFEHPQSLFAAEDKEVCLFRADCGGDFSYTARFYFRYFGYIASPAAVRGECKPVQNHL